MEPNIIFQDKYLLVLDKPTGWVVNRAKSVKEETVQDWVEANIKGKIANDRSLRNGIVHRLDKKTSGVLLVAGTKQAFTDLQQQFKERKVKKIYIALVHGKVELKKGEIKAPVGRLPWNRERFGVLPGGRSALTYFTVIKYYEDIKGNNYTLLELRPRTGRTHQIRIHLKHIRHPIVADEFYAGRKTARADRKWCPRLFLHASDIKFEHPKTGELTSFKSKLPKDLQSAAEKLVRL